MAAGAGSRPLRVLPAVRSPRDAQCRGARFHGYTADHMNPVQDSTVETPTRPGASASRQWRPGPGSCGRQCIHEIGLLGTVRLGGTEPQAEPEAGGSRRLLPSRVDQGEAVSYAELARPIKAQAGAPGVGRVKRFEHRLAVGRGDPRSVIEDP